MESDPPSKSKRRRLRKQRAEKILDSFNCTAAGFFEGLPEGELSEEEEDLLQLLCEIANLKNSFMPTEVSIQMWAENRLPASHIDLCNSSGLIDVKEDDHLHAAFRKKKPLPFSIPPLPADPIESLGKEAQDYFAEMPAELTDDEVTLREELVKILMSNGSGRITGTNGSGFGLPLSKVASNPLFLEQFHSVFPKYVEVQNWLQHRLDEDVETKFIETKQRPGSGVMATKKRKPRTDEDGYEHKKKYIVCLRREGGIRSEKSNEEWEAFRNQVQEDWFTALPEDDFAPNEDALRCVILDFLVECPHNIASLNDISSCERFISAKAQFLPLYISALRWIERRLADDVDTLCSPSGLKVLALPGSVGKDDDLDTILQGSRKN